MSEEVEQKFKYILSNFSINNGKVHLFSNGHVSHRKFLCCFNSLTQTVFLIWIYVQLQSVLHREKYYILTWDSDVWKLENLTKREEITMSSRRIVVTTYLVRYTIYCIIIRCLLKIKFAKLQYFGKYFNFSKVLNRKIQFHGISP